MEKDKKKTLTISSNLKKKINTTSLSNFGKKSFSIEKKKPFRQKTHNKPSFSQNNLLNNEQNVFLMLL